MLARRSCDLTFKLQTGSNRVWSLNVEFRAEAKENQERSPDKCGTAFAQRGIPIWRLRLRLGSCRLPVPANQASEAV